jgi:branched-chain amino acid transport system permease protein
VFEKSLLLTLGVSIVLLNGVQYVFTATPKMLETGIPFGAFNLGGVRLTYGYAVAAVTALATFAALFWFLLRTNPGRALRAVAQNREAAVNIGLDPERIARRTLMISVVLSAVAGAALGPIYVLQPNIGQAMLLKAFAVVIIGGMGNVIGAAVVALGLGVLESLVGGYTDTVWQNTIAFAAMIIVLIVRPTGLFQTTLRQG